MGRKDWRDKFLAKAEEAQENADKAKDAALRDNWLEIAQSYRDLASREEPEGYRSRS